ncbi:hypothetical protein BOTNAR_0444g00020 [Botryotinia narcissicola]|uniref:Uncharacterized protein n=1 Tax=Botryotinia narcissicola TaxID=278944 RepID=A0A4Z1HQT2_9HELO|nr:hypothetical protein BOTNAR_0444g00020 [Botryotinia narcissicola]
MHQIERDYGLHAKQAALKCIVKTNPRALGGETISRWAPDSWALLVQVAISLSIVYVFNKKIAAGAMAAEGGWNEGCGQNEKSRELHVEVVG